MRRSRIGKIIHMGGYWSASSASLVSLRVPEDCIVYSITEDSWLVVSNPATTGAANSFTWLAKNNLASPKAGSTAEQVYDDVVLAISYHNAEMYTANPNRVLDWHKEWSYPAGFRLEKDGFLYLGGSTTSNHNLTVDWFLSVIPM